MGEVVSFRPDPIERRLIERVQKRHRLKSKAEAIRFLLRRGAAVTPDDALERFLALEPPEALRLRKGRSITTEEIDEATYGEDVWRES